LGMLHDGSTLPMTGLMAASSVAAWVAFSLLARRQA
jgi:DHA1 family bicyclomycin/chloramphenicol resistance-like MFS transporter